MLCCCSVLLYVAVLLCFSAILTSVLCYCNVCYVMLLCYVVVLYCDTVLLSCMVCVICVFRCEFLVFFVESTSQIEISYY